MIALQKGDVASQGGTLAGVELELTAGQAKRNSFSLAEGKLWGLWVRRSLRGGGFHRIQVLFSPLSTISGLNLGSGCAFFSLLLLHLFHLLARFCPKHTFRDPANRRNRPRSEIGELKP